MCLRAREKERVYLYDCESVCGLVSLFVYLSVCVEVILRVCVWDCVGMRDRESKSV